MATSKDGAGLDAAPAPEPDPNADPPAAPQPVDVPPVWVVAHPVVASSEPPGGVVARLSDVPGTGAGVAGHEPGQGMVRGDRGAGGAETGADGAGAARGDDPPPAEDEGEVVLAASVVEDRARRDHWSEVAPDRQPESDGESVEVTVLDWQHEAEGGGVDEVAPDWQPEAEAEAVSEAVSEVAPDWQPEEEPDAPLRAGPEAGAAFEAEPEPEAGAAFEPEPEAAHAGPIGDGYVAVLSAAESVLDRVDRALARLDEGTYGTCEACGQPIGDDLLAADPTATTCEQHLRPVDRPI